MPSYDVRCSVCSYEAVITMRIGDLAEWDLVARCPACNQEGPQYGRVIIHAPSSFGGEKSKSRSKASQRDTVRREFTSSGKKDDMLHTNAAKRDQNQVSEAIENVRTGKFEGF